MTQLGDNWTVSYHERVVHDDIARLSKTERERIKRAIETKLIKNPAMYGLPLRGTLRQYWKLRVGDWRVVYIIRVQEIRIMVIAHRREVYKMAQRRQ